MFEVTTNSWKELAQPPAISWTDIDPSHYHQRVKFVGTITPHDNMVTEDNRTDEWQDV
jgi:hypothetical protein